MHPNLVVTFSSCIFALPIKTGVVLQNNRPKKLKNNLKKTKIISKKIWQLKISCLPLHPATQIAMQNKHKDL